MESRNILKRSLLGMAAGLAGTFALQGIRLPSQHLLPETMPPIRKDPGEFMVEQAEEVLPTRLRQQIPSVAEAVAERSLALGYGMTAGALYAAFHRTVGDLIVDGLTLGMVTWAAGYLGWMPALGLMPPITKQNAAEVSGPIVQHLLFGIVTVAIYNWLQQRIERQRTLR